MYKFAIYFFVFFALIIRCLKGLGDARAAWDFCDNHGYYSVKSFLFMYLLKSSDQNDLKEYCSLR